jgi:Ca2+-binding RTX toxin-like protein
MKHLVSALSATISLGTALTVSAAAGASEATTTPVTCHGRVATIVGSPQGGDLIGTPKADVIAAGRFEGNVINGRGGNDLICGSVHSEYLILGGPGNDRIFAGGGSDTGSGGDGADELHAGPGKLIDFVYGGAGPGMIFGGAGEDVLVGGSGDDRMWGGQGVDELFGGEGNDREWGGPGSDRVLGDPGHDRLWGGPGHHDAVDYGRKWSSWEGGARHRIALTVNLERGRASGRWFGADRLHGFTEVWTGPGNDHVVGDDLANTFFAGSGTDTIRGRGGVDTLIFTVPPVFDDGPESEMLDLAERVDVDLYNFAATLFVGGKVIGQETLYGIDNVIGTEGADTIRGNGSPNVLTGGDRYDDGTDVIFGLGGADTLLGRAGNDVLDGGRGHNSIDGGPGSDTCVNPAAGPTVTGCEQPGS